MFWGMYSLPALSDKRVIKSLFVLEGTTKYMQSFSPGLGERVNLYLLLHSLKRSGPSRHSTEQHTIDGIVFSRPESKKWVRGLGKPGILQRMGDKSYRNTGDCHVSISFGVLLGRHLSIEVKRRVLGYSLPSKEQELKTRELMWCGTDDNYKFWSLEDLALCLLLTCPCL